MVEVRAYFSMKTVVSGTSASRSPSAYMTMITAMMTQVPTQSAYASSKSHYAFIFLFQNSNHFLHLKFMVYSTHHFLHPKFTVLQIINIFIQYPLFILFSLFLAHLLVSIWIFIHGGISLCKETFMYSVRVQWFDNKIGTSCTCMSSKACSYMQWSLWVLKKYKIKICRCFVSTFLTNTGAYL